MCSDPGLRNKPTRQSASHWPALPLASLLLFLATFAVACGKQGDPLPPLRQTPQQIRDLELRQQGQLLLFEMTYPATTTGGLALGGIESLELLELVKETRDGEAPPVEGAEFERAAEPLLSLRGTSLSSSISGDRLQVRVPLSETLPEPPQVHYFAVRTTKGIETSAISNRVQIIPTTPPQPPQGFRVEATAEGIRLHWDNQEDRAVGFDVYRRPASQRGYGQPIASPNADARRFLDRGAVYGQRYIYTVRTATSRKPLIESAEAGELEIQYEDRFAPPLPLNFVALAESGSVRLRWDASTAEDVAGYFLYRQDPGREYALVTDRLIQGTEHLDRGLVAGLTYSYKIRVVDQEGNESELSRPVSTTVR